MAGQQSWWSGQAATLSLPDEGKAEELLTRRVHIMGMGSIGTFIAHSLMNLPNPPPISITMHKPEMYEDFKRKRRVVRLINPKNEINDEQTGFDIDVAERDPETDTVFWKHISYASNARKEDRRYVFDHPPNAEERLPSGEIYMHAVIVTVKSKDTVAALRAVKHRLNACSTICLIQNGMGQVDELNTQVFTDPSTRPTYMLGIISHGVHLSSNFVAIHAGFGSVALGVVRDLDKHPLPPKSPTTSRDQLSPSDRARYYPSDADLYAALSSRYVLRTLTRSPILTCAAFPYLDLLQLQLEKLSTNCVLNPLTALLDIPNGSILYNSALSKAQRLLIAEISLVLRTLPELTSVPGVAHRFSPARLEQLLISVAAKTAENSSSMREDVRKMRATEVEYINGYIVKRGEEQGIKPVLNYLIMQLVQGKTWSLKSAEGEALPLERGGRIEGKSASATRERPVMIEDTGGPGRGGRI